MSIPNILAVSAIALAAGAFAGTASAAPAPYTPSKGEAGTGAYAGVHNVLVTLVRGTAADDAATPVNHSRNARMPVVERGE